MPVFDRSLGKVSTQDPQEALKQMANHIRYIQEKLEYTLSNLDSSNITEIETDKTNITSSTGSMNLSSNLIELSAETGETFRVGKDAKSGRFVFEIKGKGGTQYMYINSNGEMVITKNATLSIDCGEW